MCESFWMYWLAGMGVWHIITIFWAFLKIVYWLYIDGTNDSFMRLCAFTGALAGSLALIISIISIF